MLPSFWRHQRCVLYVQLFWYVDHEHGDPSSGEDHDDYGISSNVQDLHEA